MEAQMKHSQTVHAAMQQAFKELLALSPQELRNRLKKRELGPLGKLMKESQSTETLLSGYRYDRIVGSLLDTNHIHLKQNDNGYILSDFDAEWLKAA